MLRPALRSPGKDHSIPVQIPHVSRLADTQCRLRDPILAKTPSSSNVHMGDPYDQTLRRIVPPLSFLGYRSVHDFGLPGRQPRGMRDVQL